MISRSEIITYIQKYEPDFYTLVCANIEIEMGANITKMLSGKITEDDITERVMTRMKPNISQDIYDMHLTGHETEEEKQAKIELVDDAIKGGIKLGVNKTFVDIKKMME